MQVCSIFSNSSKTFFSACVIAFLRHQHPSERELYLESAMTFGHYAFRFQPPAPKSPRTLTPAHERMMDHRFLKTQPSLSFDCNDRPSLRKTMSSFRNPFLRTSRIFPRCLRRNYSSPPPTYPAHNPIHVNPALLGQRSQFSSFLRFCLAGASIGLPAYWILWLGQKVSIPYCKPPYVGGGG